MRIEMSLSAFGVESDGFPSIQANLDFKSYSGRCHVSYDNPKYKDSTYTLTNAEMRSIADLLLRTKLDQLKEYKEGTTDQPTSITKIYTNKELFQIKDYALQAAYPINELYRIVYKLKINVR